MKMSYQLKETFELFQSKVNFWIVLLLIVAGTLFAACIPPFQSPDEPAHVNQAYLLSTGQIFLKNGCGEIDKGLTNYAAYFSHMPFSPAQKFSKEEAANAALIQWTGNKKVCGIAAYYFPLAYTPQALGLGLGRVLHLSVQNSYYLARFSALFFSIMVLTLSFLVFPMNPFLLSLLIVPMMLFQFASPTLDGFTTALIVLCAALFMRGCVKSFEFPRWMSYVLAAGILLLANSRMNLLPLLACPLLIWYARKYTCLLWQFFFLLVFSVIWNLMSIKASYMVPGPGQTTSQIILFYLKNPSEMLSAYYHTLASSGHRNAYIISFIGVLGWLDTNLSGNIHRFYYLVFVSLFFLVLSSISLKTLKEDWFPRVALIVLSLASCFLIFFALLVTWNAVPAQYIEGVQGRYFIGPLVMLAYALGGSVKPFEGVLRKIALIPLLLIIALDIFHVPDVLINRYYLASASVTTTARLQAGEPIRDR